MRRSLGVYLADIIDSCETILGGLAGIDFASYEQDRILRSAVEREFILIGEAVAHIRDLDSEVFSGISNAAVIVGFRNVLTHDYASIDDATVYGVATSDLSLLRDEC